MLHEQFIQIDLFSRWIIKIRPFDWHLLFKSKIRNYGDRDDYTITILCLEIYFQGESRQGKEGRLYREELKRSGQWNPDKK